MTARAKIITVPEGEFETVVLIAGLWRVFGTPYSLANETVKPFKLKKSAKQSAEKIADEFGITLKWEV